MSGHDRAAEGGGHAGHAHGVSADADRSKLAIALGLIVGFMIVEVVVGAIVHSLALLSDAAHMLTDAGALGLSIVAINLAKRTAKGASMNVEGSFQHLLTDLAAFIFTAIAGVVTLATGFKRADGTR